MSKTVERVVTVHSSVGMTNNLALVMSARLAYLHAEIRITRVDKACSGVILGSYTQASVKFIKLLLSMNLEHGDEVWVKATGDEAAFAVGEIEHLMKHRNPVPYSHLCTYAEDGPRGHGPSIAVRNVTDGLNKLNLLWRG